MTLLVILKMWKKPTVYTKSEKAQYVDVNGILSFTTICSIIQNIVHNAMENM